MNRLLYSTIISSGSMRNPGCAGGMAWRNVLYNTNSSPI